MTRAVVFAYHDVGEAFYQMQYDGSLVKKWRTPPLWGVGHTAPYGHDGASLDLEAAIKLAPKHADAHIALGAFHAEVIDKVGALVGCMTYGVRADAAIALFDRVNTNTWPLEFTAG